MTQYERHQSHFEKLFSSVPVSADKVSKDLRAVAQSVWYEDFVPDLTSLQNSDALRRAGYVVEYLASKHLVTPERKRVLKQVANVARSRLDSLEGAEQTFYKNDTPPVKNRDAFAKRWQLAAGMKPRLLGLLDMQRRAYTPPNAMM